MTSQATIPRSLLEDGPVSIGIWLGFLAMCVGMFMAILDIQIVASSLPDIGAALGIPHDQLSWVQTAYLIAEVIGISLTGRLTRLVSLGRLFVLAISGFTLASLFCAMSPGFGTLIAFRVVQGFCGGMVIPIVFNAVFVIFPERSRVLATTVAGVFAMLAPTLGPTVGGYITETYTWHWLFLINLAPGVLVAIVAGWRIRIGQPEWRLWSHLDYLGVVLCAVFLASLEILLKEGPKRNWSGAVVMVLAASCIVCGILAVIRCLWHRAPVVALDTFGDRVFAINAGYSFLLGAGLYGSVYLLPIFLGFVRQHSPLEIGEIMFVTGAAQLAVAPLAAIAEKRMDSRLLIALGYGLFAAGLIANGFATYETDFRELFWPQILRGLGVMLCLLPTTTLALERRTGEALSDASALFNLMRNLGGAIGIAFADTILEQRTPVHVSALIARLQAGDAGAARLVGLPLARFHNVPLGPIDQATKDAVAPLVERAALVLSFNEAWIALGVVVGLSLLALPLLRRSKAGAIARPRQAR
jgi:DHA2 family multidrug resistance protein